MKSCLLLIIIVLLSAKCQAAQNDNIVVEAGVYYFKDNGPYPYYAFVNLDSVTTTVDYYQKNEEGWYYMKSDTLTLVTEALLHKWATEGNIKRAVKFMGSGKIAIDTSDKKVFLLLDVALQLRLRTAFTDYWQVPLKRAGEEQLKRYEYLRLHARKWEGYENDKQ